MRLVCPKCDARYEIGDGLITGAGRDVQCSNCNATWFQTGAPVADVKPAPSPAPVPPAAPKPTAADPDLSAETPPAMTARTFDPKVIDILREEASRENALPAKEPATPTKPAAMPKPPAPAPAAPVQPTTPKAMQAAFAAPAAAAVPPPGRSLTHEEELAAQKRRGFRRGFAATALLLALLVLAYIYAPQISAAMPDAAGVVKAYVAQVDMLRGWLDVQVGAAGAALQEILPQPDQAAGDS